MVIDLARMYVSCQAFSCSQARVNTIRPKATITSPASAVGMNWPGASMPSSGWCQRTEASAPVRLPSRRPKVGW